MNKKKLGLLLTVLSVVLIMGIAYAAFTAITLKVNTSATASASVFNVSFYNSAPVIEKSNDNIIVNATTPSKGDKEISLSVAGLKNPGDTASIDYCIINEGDIDAIKVMALSGPLISEGNSWTEGFVSPGSTWESEDGTFRFGVYNKYCGEVPEEIEEGTRFWSVDGPLETGMMGTISVEVTLLKRVDTETTASCTAKLTATPADDSVQ